MKRIQEFLSTHGQLLLAIFGAVVCMTALFLYKLGSLAGGLSPAEVSVAHTPVGWHGLLADPFNLPLQFLRSIVFSLFDPHGATLTRLPNVAIGAISLISFGFLLRLWHSGRVALLATILFATSAWTLHISRYASSDVLYLMVVPLLLLTQVLLHRYVERFWVAALILLTWAWLLFTPGVVWLVLLAIYWQRRDVVKLLKTHRLLWQRSLVGVIAISWLPLLIRHFVSDAKNVTLWFGLPGHFSSISALGHQLIAVPFHLFIQAPAIPELWLGHLPLLDIFSLVTCVLGLYFYGRNWRAGRAHILASYLVVGSLLVGLGGAVRLSVVVPLLFIAIAAGLSWLQREWLQKFPLNPVARGIGIGLLIAAVGVSSAYNLRSYFVAWPHSAITRASFNSRP